MSYNTPWREIKVTISKEKILIVEDLEPQVLETVRIQCPKCGADIKANSINKEEITCFCCDRKIRVKDRFGDNVEVIQETLLLPKGSIRAIVTISISMTCWILIFQGKPVPNYLFNLLIAVISYYFAFRKKDANQALFKTVMIEKDEFSDITASGQKKPLYLPSGAIRYFLIAGFALCGFLVLKEKIYDELPYLEFFVILSGLVLGYFFAKFADVFKKNILVYNKITHVKGVIVLLAAFMIAGTLLTGAGTTEFQTRIPLLCACIVTFYFGSKS